MFPIATSKDIFVFYDSASQHMAITRRNNEGTYQLVGNFSESTSGYAVTNGKWVALHGEGVALFNIDANNKVSDVSYVGTYGGFLLSDDTFVGLFGELIQTYEYDADNNDWNSINGTELVVPADLYAQGDFASYRATDTHLIFIDNAGLENATIEIYERLANKSWGFIDSVPVNGTDSEGSVTYNGVDTLVVAYPQVSDDSGLTAGIVFIYTKIGGEWTQQKFSAPSVGYKPIALFGYSSLFLDTDHLLISAGFEGVTFSASISFVGGKVLLLTRKQDGSWEPTLDLAARFGIFGLGMGVNDNDLIVATAIGIGPIVNFNIVPRCFYHPINVTCRDQQANDCADLATAELYTINNPQCGAVTTNLKGLSLVNNNQLEAEFSFTRSDGAAVSCSAMVTCPAPPTQTTDTPNVSGATGLHIGLVSLLAGAVFVL